MSWPRPLRSAGLAAASLLAIGCGTTVSGSAASTAAARDQLVAPGGQSQAAGATGAGAGAAVAGAVSGPGALASGPGGNGTATGGFAGSGSTAAGGIAAGAPGVTATTINVGLSYATNSQAAAAALGVSGAGVGGNYGQDVYNIIIKDINDHGGVLGRKLVPIWHAYDSTSQDSLDQQESAACSDWTQDHKVFAVVAQEATPDNTLLSCVNRAGAVQLWQDFTTSDASTFAKFPYYVEGGTLQQDRLAPQLPAALASSGYFSGWDYNTGSASKVTPVKVGVIAFDDSKSTTAVNRFLVPALKALGYAPLTEFVSYPTSEAGNGTSISQTDSAVLKFRQNGVSHVIPWDSQGAGIGYFFALGANGQKYYPRFGLQSGDGMQILLSATNSSALAQELTGALGWGWVPLADVDPTTDPDNGPYSNTARRSCVQLMTKHGQDMTSDIAKRQAVDACDMLHLLKTALEGGGQTISRASFLVGVDNLATRFVSGFTFATRLDRSHHDGAASWRAFTFVSGCSCFHYTGATRSLN